MWHYLQRKTNKVWIWKAYDRATGRLVDWECGDRDEQTFRRLFERLARWNVRLFCSDRYVVYPLVLGSHYQGKSETVALERNNAQQRHGQRPCGGAPSLSPSHSPCLSRIQRMRCRPDSGGLPPRKGSNVGLLCSPISTSIRMLPLRCTGCQSRAAGSSYLPKMQH